MTGPLISSVKMVAALIALYFSSVYRLPIILPVCFVWCGWLWFAGREWKGRLLATLGLGLMALSWWIGTSLWSYLARNGEASHFAEGREFWAGLAMMTGNVGIGLTVAGILLLTYADYRRRPRPKQTLEVSNEAQADQTNVWPPAPKKPH